MNETRQLTMNTLFEAIINVYYQTYGTCPKELEDNLQGEQRLSCTVYIQTNKGLYLERIMPLVRQKKSSPYTKRCPFKMEC